MITRTRAVLALGASATVVLSACGSTGTSGVQRSEADLTSAILSASDLPPGFTVKPSDDSGSPTVAPGSSQACQDLGAITFSKSTPGALTIGKADFVGPSNAKGSEEIDAMGTQAKAEALVDKFKTAATGCPEMSAVLEGKTYKFKIEVGTGSGGGSHDSSYAMTGLGDLAGFSDFGQVTVVGDTIVNTDISEGGDAASAVTLNEKAVTKAKSTLKIQ
jgi:hypothetical protein